MGIDGDRLHKSDRWDFGTRIREVEVHADGSVWLLTDGRQAAPSGENRGGEARARKAGSAPHGKAFAQSHRMLQRLPS